MQIHNVEQNTPEWFALRAGKPTASEFSKLVTSTGERSKSLEKYAMTLAAEKFAGGGLQAWEGNAHTQRGHDLEQDAINAYALMHDTPVERVGFVTDDAETIGCSPDGLVGEDGMVEIKCLQADNHVEAILYFQKHKKAPPKYYQQTQGQVWICKRKWCDLVFYHPSLPMLSVRGTPNARFLQSLDGAIKDVLAQRDAAVKALGEI